MQSVTFRTVLKLLICSLIVGGILSWLDISPAGLARWLTSSVRELAADFQHNVWALGSYVLLGAIIVVPLWLIRRLWRARR